MEKKEKQKYKKEGECKTKKEMGNSQILCMLKRYCNGLCSHLYYIYYIWYCFNLYRCNRGKITFDSTFVVL